MTTKSVHQAIDAEQARAILENLQLWIAVAPFRRVSIQLEAGGKWRAFLETGRRKQSAGGLTMSDALAQIATVAGVEVRS